MFRKPPFRISVDDGPLRTGNVLVLAAGCLVLVFAFVAFTVDVGYITLTKAELQRAADAGALASAIELHDALGTGPLVSQSTAESNARQAAADVAAANRGGGRNSVHVDSARDVRLGQYCWDADSGTWVKNWGTAPYNLVEVTARRDQDGSSAGDEPLDLFFAPVIGHEQAKLVQRSTAVLFAGGGFRKRPGENVGILPITLDEQTWNDMIENSVGTDNYSWSETNGNITPQPDGILEINLYPYGPQELPAGNRGTVDFGNTGNATSDLARQILYGLNDADFAALADQGIPELNFDSGPFDINGDTGLSAGIADELNAIRGEPRAIPIFSTVSGPGNNAIYTIVKFVGVRIMHVKLTGNPNSKHVIVQPCPFSDFAVIPSQGPILEDSIFTPPTLVP